MQIITDTQLIILHSILQDVKKGLKWNSNLDHFEMNRPLTLSFDLTNFRELEKIEKTLDHVLENLQGLATENTQATDISIQPGNDAGTKGNGLRVN